MTRSFDLDSPSVPAISRENAPDALSQQGKDGASEAESKPDLPGRLPVLPVRDVVIFNYTILPLFVGRDASVQAVEAALQSNRYLLILTQKDEQVDKPAPADLHSIGTVVMIMRMLKLPDGRLKLLVQGVSRARALSVTDNKPYLEAEIKALPEQEQLPQSVAVEALMRAAREQSERILTLRGMVSPDVINVLGSIEHPGRLADLIASNLRMKLTEAQELLECLDPVERLKMVNELLTKEAEVASMQAHIQETAREGMDKAQRDYYLREQLKAIRKELGEGASDDDDEIAELAAALEKAKLPPEAQKEADKQLKRLSSMHAESSEAGVLRGYLEWLSELPWARLSRDRLDIIKAKKILDEDHYGLEKVKDRILEFLSVRKLNPKSKSPILCFVGPPGVGKTSLGRSIARSMGRQFQRMSLGGMRDEAEIRGHRRTYVGALPGRVIQSLKQAGTRNPVIMLDEVDKIGSDFRGDPSSALLEVLDPEQNFSFSDHYLNLPFDLSKVMFICTANHLETIPGPLKDRMEIIRIPGYTMQEKLGIAQRYLVDRQEKENGLKKKDVVFKPGVLETLIQGYTREAGVRGLEREIGAVARKLARKKAEGTKAPFVVDDASLKELLGAPRYLDDDLDKTPVPGLAVGLAWTPHGGEVLNVEVSTMQGKGGVTLTGQLGEVMKESAQAAVSYARSHARELGIDPEFNSKLDVHVHVPAGATPKDGPSAGVTLATALVSALSGKVVRDSLCMTGEITLRGRVLPVGGIKEKILAAVARGLGDVIIPKQNEKDLEEIPQDLLSKIAVHPMDNLADVIALAFSEKRGKKASVKSSGTPGGNTKNKLPRKRRNTDGENRMSLSPFLPPVS
ncbi:MAG: endopeptidase La [Desulfovibrio sp.]|jgi:ATP-dependent Lon protease|nr:endopeptidase La [Desulfovibrio sp.]